MYKNKIVLLAIICVYIYHYIYDDSWISYDQLDNIIHNITKIDIDENINKVYLYSNQTYKLKISTKESFLRTLGKYNTTNVKTSFVSLYSPNDFIYSIINGLYGYIVTFIIISIFLNIYYYISDKLDKKEKDKKNTKLAYNGIIASLSSDLEDNEFIITKNSEITFDNIIGHKTAKDILLQSTKFLTKKSEYINLGAKPPKGILFTGPPGTGKTLFAKALANLLNVNLICVSGSDFSDKYLGEGQNKVKRLFSTARENSPCIIFIDEIDAIGIDRKSSKSLVHSENLVTLNQLLFQMDGINNNDNVLVLGATNFKKSLDSALLRSGRFDINITFDIPNINERKDMFKYYLNKVKKSRDFSDLELEKLAKLTAGLTGADICNIVNQSIMKCIIKTDNPVDCKGIDVDYVINSIDDIIIGFEKRERLMTQKEKKITAYHEAGHCLISKILKTNIPIKVSIIPRGEDALGFTQYEPNDKKMYSIKDMKNMICSLYGGRVAEEIKFKTQYTGAEDDIKKATSLAYRCIKSLGFNQTLGLINLYDNDQISDLTKNNVDLEIQKLLFDQYNKAKSIINNNKEFLDILANKLLESEEIYRDDINQLYCNYKSN